MGNRLCDCKNTPDYLQYDFNYLQAIEKNLVYENNEEMKIEVIDSYNIENNLFNLNYLKQLVKLQRRIKMFLQRIGFTKVKKVLGHQKFSNKTLRANSLLSVDMQTVLSHNSSKISNHQHNIGLKGFFIHNKTKYKYHGERVDGQKEGFGVLRFDDGSTFAGNFKNNKANGICIYKNQGSIFNGKIGFN
jgi:hypothetical protein